jgi:peptidoglycan/xylan/chitin deacetylase (PgdA/CDA1 family)
VILLYHRIAEPANDPFALAVPPAWFADHLEIVASRANIVTLDEILTTERTHPNVFTSITFDDGYVDNLEVASPILQQADVSATFFICTGALGAKYGFWWDRLSSALAAAADPAQAYNVMQLGAPVGDLSTVAARVEATLEFAAHLQPMHPAARDALVSELETRLLAGSDTRRETCPVLDAAGVGELASRPLTQVGAHTHGHPMLSQLSRDEQRAEITRSVTDLEAITGTRPHLFAYPYGGEHDYNDDSCSAAADAEMTAAFVNHSGRFDAEQRPYRIPRYYVPPLPADGFRAWLDGILAA